MSETQQLIDNLLNNSTTYTSIELFAGAGGMALGMEKAGIEHLLLNDFDKYATQTLKHNRPHWNVIHGDIAKIDFTPYKGVDLVTGGFPCQAFSYAGKKRGMEDTRGTLFYEFARALKESEPKVFLAENVKGLKSHDGGRTLETMVEVFKSMGLMTNQYKQIGNAVPVNLAYALGKSLVRFLDDVVKSEFRGFKNL